jgi:hypothetical protein
LLNILPKGTLIADQFNWLSSHASRHIEKSTLLGQMRHFCVQFKPIGITGFFMNTATFESEALSGLSAASVLGGEPVLHALPRSVLEWIALVRQGISAGAVDAVVRVMGIGQSELSRALDIPERTLARRKKKRFKPQ